MTDPDTDRAQAIALFRYGLIAELVRLPPGTKGLAMQLIAEKAARDVHHPRQQAAPALLPRPFAIGSRRIGSGGFAALLPKPRADRGQARVPCPRRWSRRCSTAKEANPKLSVAVGHPGRRPEIARGPQPSCPCPTPPCIGCFAQSRPDGPRRREDPSERDRRRFAFAQAGELWMSDVMHGPSVVVGDRTKRKTYLIAFIDDATRVIPLRGLCAVGEQRRPSCRCCKPGHPEKPRAAPAPVCRQRGELPLPAPGAGVCQAQHRAHPRATLPTPGQGQDRTLFQDPARSAAHPPGAAGHREPHRAEPPPGRVGGGGVSP
jgi:hypothetical protein